MVEFLWPLGFASGFGLSFLTLPGVPELRELSSVAVSERKKLSWQTLKFGLGSSVSSFGKGHRFFFNSI